MQNKSGRIVSKAKHGTAKRENRLVKAGYGTKKGTFGYVKMNGKSKRGRKSKRGGGMYALSPTPYNGKGVGTSGNAVQFAAGNAN